MKSFTVRNFCIENMPEFEQPKLKTPKCLKEVRKAQHEQRTK
jgi:hypothetical protein